MTNKEKLVYVGILLFVGALAMPTLSRLGVPPFVLAFALIAIWAAVPGSFSEKTSNKP
jgi:hypothetical protein